MTRSEKAVWDVLTSLFQFRRKSVEGLSMYLFVFAFLGNLFYVMSILTSPMMSESFFFESVPSVFLFVAQVLFAHPL